MAAATMYVTVAGAGDKSGDSWANAMGYAEWETDIEGASEAGDIYYVAGGTYTLTSHFTWSTRDGSITAPCFIIGVKSGTTNEPPVLADWASGDDRPLLAGGAYYTFTGDYWRIFNFRSTSSADDNFLFNLYSIAYNIKCSGTAKWAITLYNYAIAISCDVSSTRVDPGGMGFYLLGGSTVLFSYIHDCAANGIGIYSTDTNILFNVIDTCTTYGIAIEAYHGCNCLNNTIYNCGTGIHGTIGGYSKFINNIINDCTVGAAWDTQTDSNFWLNNNLEGNGTQLTNIETALPHGDWLATAVNPAFTDDAGGDFSLASGSGCIDAGLAITLGVS